MLQQLHLEISGLAANGFDLAECFQFNVQVPADLDQFR